MPSLAELYEQHAQECIRSAGRTDNPKYREMLLKMERAGLENLNRTISGVSA